MALNNLGINITINVNAPGAQQAASQAAAGLNQIAQAGQRAAQAAGGARQQFQQLAGAFTSMLVGKQVLGFIGGLAMKADEVSQGMANMRVVMAESFDPKQAEHLKNTLMSVSEQTGRGFKDLAEISKELISQGLDVKQVENIITPLSKFITVGDISATKATELTVALTNMGIASEKAGEAYDVMQNLAIKTTIRTPEFVDIMTRAAPAATLAKQSFIELASSAALLRKSFGSGKEEATSLFQTLSTLERTKIQDKIKKAFGVEVAADRGTGALKPLLTIIQEVNNAILKGHGTTSNLFDIFGGKTGAKVFAGGITSLQQGLEIGGVKRSGQDLIDSMRSTATQSVGAVDMAFSSKMESLLAQLGRLKTAFDDLLGVLGGSFANSLQNIVGGIANVVSGLREWLTQHSMIAHALDVILNYGLRILAIGAGILFVSGAAKLGKIAIANLAMAFEGVGLGAKIASAGVGGFWKALLGPVGLVLAVLSFIPDIFSLFSSGSNPASDVSKSLRDASLGNENAADKLNQAANALDESAKEFNAAVVEYTKLLVKRFPTFDVPKQTQATGFALGMAKDFGIDQTELNEAAQKVQAYLHLKPGQQVTQQMTSEATRAGQLLSGFLSEGTARKVPGAEKAKKAMEDFVENIELQQTKPMVDFTSGVKLLREGRDPTLPGAPLTNHRYVKDLKENPVDNTVINGQAVPLPKGNLDNIIFDKNMTVPGGLRIPRPAETTTKRTVTEIDKPITLTIDGQQVPAILKVQKSIDDVTGLRSP